MAPNKKYCGRAIAYLKARGPESERAISFSEYESPVLKDLGNGLLVAYLVDEGDRFSYVQNRHLSDAGILTNELHEIGISNLRAIANERLQVRRYGSVYAVLLDGNFEASLILINDLWKSTLAHLVTSEFVVAVPAKDVLAFCDSSSVDGLAELGRIVQRAEAGDHLLTPVLCRRNGEEWRQYVA